MQNPALCFYHSFRQGDLQGVYWPRNPKATDFYALVEDNYQQLEWVYEEQFEKQHSYWRPFIYDVIYKYLDCGDLHRRSARVRCRSCNSEYLF